MSTGRRNETIRAGVGLGWFSNETALPAVYQQAMSTVCAQPTDPYPNTAAVYNLLLTSGLSKETLGHVWSLVNRTVPGQLTRVEFYMALALIAQIQVFNFYFF